MKDIVTKNTKDQHLSKVVKKGTRTREVKIMDM